MNTNGAGTTPTAKVRFCPKCGVQLPGNAAFCAKCGSQLPASPPQQVAAPQKAPSKSFSPASIVARICAVIAVIAMFMPWLEIPGLKTLGNYASMIGINVPRDFSYSMYDMGDVTKVLDTLSNSNAYSAIHMVFLILWVVALALIVIGLIRSFTGQKSSGSLLVGGIVAALVALLWFAAVMFLDGEYSRQLAQIIGSRVQFFEVPAAVWLTVVFGLASGILGVAGKSKA